MHEISRKKHGSSSTRHLAAHCVYSFLLFLSTERDQTFPQLLFRATLMLAFHAVNALQMCIELCAPNKPNVADSALVRPFFCMGVRMVDDVRRVFGHVVALSAEEHSGGRIVRLETFPDLYWLSPPDRDRLITGGKSSIKKNTN